MLGKTTTCRLTAFNQAATGGSSYEPERKPLEIITPSTLSGMVETQQMMTVVLACWRHSISVHQQVPPAKWLAIAGPLLRGSAQRSD